MTTELDRAAGWLRRHGFPDTSPTPLLAARLTVRWRSQLAAQLVLAAFLIAVALTYKHAPHGVVVLTLVVTVMVAAQSGLYWWVRRTDRRFGHALTRRVTHPTRLGWRTVLGLPRAAIAVTVFAGGAALALHALSLPGRAGRYPGLILLIGLSGAAVAMLVQLRHVLTRPVVADDEMSLRADLVMRVEDAREAASPTVLWALPASSVLAATGGWWGDGWLVFVALSLVAFVAVNLRSHFRDRLARGAASQATAGTVAR